MFNNWDSLFSLIEWLYIIFNIMSKFCLHIKKIFDIYYWLIGLFICLFIYVCLSVYPSIHPSIHLSIYLSISNLSIYLSIYINLSIYQFIYLYIYLSINSFIHSILFMKLKIIGDIVDYNSNATLLKCQCTLWKVNIVRVIYVDFELMLIWA